MLEQPFDNGEARRVAQRGKGAMQFDGRSSSNPVFNIYVKDAMSTTPPGAPAARTAIGGSPVHSRTGEGTCVPAGWPWPGVLPWLANRFPA
jgi:hypothetical protein